MPDTLNAEPNKPTSKPVVLCILDGWGDREAAPAKTDETYECGVDTIGSSWIRFSVSFYLFALIFVAFEVDVLYLFPIAVVYDQGFEWRDLVEVTMFLGILTLGIFYAWRRGVFEWR